MAKADIESILAARRPGRAVWNEPSICGLNRLPIVSLKPRILGKTSHDELQWPLDDVCERLLVDGSLAAYKGVLLDGIIDCRPGLITQDYGEVTRVYEQVKAVGTLAAKAKSAWLVRDVVDYGTDEEKDADDGELPSGGLKVSNKDIWHWPNGRGILQPAQEQYDLLEDVAVRIDEQMSGAALALIILGFNGNWEAAKAQLNTGPRIANFPGRGVSVQRVGSTAVIDHLISEFSLHFPLYQRLTYWLDTSVGANTSGTAWSIRLEEVHYFVQQQQTNLKRIYAQVNPGVDLQFANYQIRSSDERTKDFALLQQMLESRVIEEKQFKAAALALLP